MEAKRKGEWNALNLLAFPNLDRIVGHGHFLSPDTPEAAAAHLEHTARTAVAPRGGLEELGVKESAIPQC